MQGVYVVVGENGGKIKLQYNKHVFRADTKDMNRPMRAPQIEDENFMRVRMQVNSQNSGADRMYVIQYENTTRGYDNGYDAKNIIAQGQANIYTNELDGQMEISVADQIDSTFIGFAAGEDSEYILTFTSLVGQDMYLHDMQFCQYFATLNRYMMAKIILNSLFDKELEDFEHFETIHNYIDMQSNIIRKGAVSAKSGEKLLIPINMRDGSLICIGKGNEDWNCSAPHGAGRLFSRIQAKEKFTVEEFQDSMQGIYSTCISHRTIDESPMAYKSMDDIVNNISPTADIIRIIKPVYNFKAE
jgi:hypothetical protein